MVESLKSKKIKGSRKLAVVVVRLLFFFLCFIFSFFLSLSLCLQHLLNTKKALHFRVSLGLLHDFLHLLMNPPDASITFSEAWVLSPTGARLSGAFFLSFFRLIVFFFFFQHCRHLSLSFVALPRPFGAPFSALAFADDA